MGRCLVLIGYLRKALGDHLDLDEPGIQKRRHEVPVLLAERAELAQRKIFSFRHHPMQGVAADGADVYG